MVSASRGGVLLLQALPVQRVGRFRPHSSLMRGLLGNTLRRRTAKACSCTFFSILSSGVSTKNQINER